MGIKWREERGKEKKKKQFICQLCASMADAKLVYYLSELTVVVLLQRGDEKSWPWASTVQLIPDMPGYHWCHNKICSLF